MYTYISARIDIRSFYTFLHFCKFPSLKMHHLLNNSYTPPQCMNNEKCIKIIIIKGSSLIPRLRQRLRQIFLLCTESKVSTNTNSSWIIAQDILYIRRFVTLIDFLMSSKSMSNIAIWGNMWTKYNFQYSKSFYILSVKDLGCLALQMLYFQRWVSKGTPRCHLYRIHLYLTVSIFLTNIFSRRCILF